MLKSRLRGYRYPVEVIEEAVWQYHRFNSSLRDVSEHLSWRGIEVSHETIRTWSNRFGPHFRDILKKRERSPSDKWHLDEMLVRINGTPFVLWRAVDSEGMELDILLQKRRDKKSAVRFLVRLFHSYPSPRVVVTDKLRSYAHPLRTLCPKADHRAHKGLNNRVENAHQPTRRKEKVLVRFKSPHGAQNTLSLMGKVRNLFSVERGRYTLPAAFQKQAFQRACLIWREAGQSLICA
jgi:putative transposase